MTKGMIHIDSTRFNQILAEFGEFEGKAPLALSRAINRAVSSAKTEAVRTVRKEYTAKAGKINKTIRITRSKPGALTATIFSSGAAIPLSEFKVSPKTVNPRRRTALSVEVRRGAKATLDRAFMARMPNGKVGVFERTGTFRIATKGSHKGQRREDIDQKFGPAVPMMLNADSVTSAVQRRAEEQLEARLPHEINRILGVR